MPNTPLRIVSAASSFPFYVDPSNMFTYAGVNASTIPYSLFFAFQDKDPSSLTSIRAGETAVLKSHTTGLFCMLADVPGAASSRPSRRPP